MATGIDKYINQATKNGLDTSDMYKYEPKKQINTINESSFKGYTPEPLTSIRSFDITPTLEVSKEREAFDGLYDNIISIYGQSKAGETIKGDSRYAVDSLIATALGKDYTEVAGNHKYYVRAIMGTDMEDDSFLKAFADNYTTYWTNRKLSWKQLQFDWTNDEEERKVLLDDIEELEQELIKKQDYKDRNFVAKNMVAAAPIINQVVESLALTYGGAAVGGAVAGLASKTLSSGNAISQIAIGANRALQTTSAISKGARIGVDAGIALGFGNTYALEAGGLSRELYNMVDEDGNRISDNARRTTAAIGGALIALEEYITPDPVAGFAKLGRFPKTEAKKSFKKWALSYGIHRFADANAESLEEGVQSFTGAISKDIAKYYSNKSGNTNFESEEVVQQIGDALLEGWDSYKETFMPVFVSSFIPGTARDLTTLRKSIMQGRDIQMHTKNSKALKQEAWKWQGENDSPNVISMDLIAQKAEKPTKDYGRTADGAKAEKIQKINVVSDPANPDYFVGATAKDDDILKWAFNKGYKAVDVNILEHGSSEISTDSIKNMARQYGGSFDSNVLTVSDDTKLSSIKTDLEDLGIDVKADGKSFSFINSDTGKKVTVEIANQKDSQSAKIVQNSKGILSNRDFVTEIKNALTDNGQLETTISDRELELVSNLAGMLGNDVTDRISFVSAYDESLTDAENKALDGARGVTSFDDALRSAKIILSDQSDTSTVVHEMFHVALKYNDSSRANLVNAVRNQTKNAQRRKALKAFLSEHQSEILGDSIRSIDGAMRILDNLDSRNVLSTAESQEVLTKMFETFMDSESEVKNSMPTGIRKIFTELADAFRKIYRNVTGKTLMPERIAEAYYSFLSEDGSASESYTGTGSEILKQEYISQGGWDEWNHRSNRATEAYEIGEKPISKWTTEAFNDAFDDAIGEYNISRETAEALKALPLGAKKTLLQYSSWHHVGIFYQEVDFYSLPDLTGITVEDVKAYKERYDRYKKSVNEYNKLKKSNPDAIEEYGELRRYRNVDYLDGVEIPSDISDFIDSLGKEYETSSRGNVYRNNEKPRHSWTPKDGIVTLRGTGDGIALMKYDENTDTYNIISEEIKTKASPKELVTKIKDPSNYEGSTAKETIAKKPGLYSYNVFLEHESEGEILRQSTPEERVADKATASIPRVNTFASFSETDVTDMIDAGVFVPEALLDKFATNSVVEQEKADRSVMEGYLADNEVRKALVEHGQVQEFLDAMKEYYGTGYNSNTEEVLRKIFAYSKTQTPSQMRKSFRAEYGTGNIDKLMELKSMLTRRRINKVSKNGKSYSQVLVPDTANTYNLIKNLDRMSSEADIKKVTDSINSNTNMWLRDYLKASELDYAKHFVEAEVGNKDYLKTKSALMYLTQGEADFSLVKEIRNASKVESFSAQEKAEINALQKQIDELNKTIRDSDSKAARMWARIDKKEIRKEQNALKENLKARKAEEKELRENLKELGTESPRVSPIELQKLYYEDELSALTDLKDEEIAKKVQEISDLKEKHEGEISDLKAKSKDRLETEKIKSMLKADEIEARYKEKIHKLEVERDQIKYDLENDIKDAKRIEKYKAIWGNYITEQNLIEMYDDRIRNLKLRYQEAAMKRKLTGQLKKRLNADHNVYSSSIDDSLKWIYSLMHNKKGLSDIDYERYAMKTGESTDADVLIFTPAPDEFIDSDGNVQTTSYEFDPKAYNFDRTIIPEALARYGFSGRATAELISSRRYSQLSIETLSELVSALDTAKSRAKAEKTAMDSVKQQRRVELASDLYSSVTKADGGIPDNALNTILSKLNINKADYDASPALQSQVMREFTSNISRYSDILQNTPSRKEKALGWVANTIGHIQWVADYLESDKNGPIHNLFVTRSQKALNEYSAMKELRNANALEAMKKAVGGDENWSKIYKTLKKKDAVDITYNSNDGNGAYSYRDGKISLDEALGIYIYSQNWQSLGNLVSGKGNNFSLETIARINPDALKKFLEVEIENLNDYDAMVSSLPPRSEIPAYKSALFADNTRAEIETVYSKLMNGEYDSAVPDWVKSLGDAMIDTLSGTDGEYTKRMDKFAGEVMNAPFTMQERYFPKVSDGTERVSVIGDVEGAQSKRISSGAIKDRQSAFNYSLRLDPVNVLFGAIEAQERLINMYDVVSDMNYLMSDKGNNFGAVVESLYGNGMKKFLNSQIADLAGNKMILSDYEKVANKILQNVAVSKIGFNVMTTAKQLLSAITAGSSGEIGYTDVLNGIALASGNNKATADALYNKYASDLAGSSLGYEYTLLRQRQEVTGRDSLHAKLVDASMKWTEATDQTVKKWTWMGAFDKFTKQGMSEEEAGLRATEVVKKTQSIGDSYSLSNFERNRSPFVRSFAMFSKDQFQIWNSLVFGIASDVKNQNYGVIAERAIGIGLLTLATAAIAGGWLPDEGEDGFNVEAFLSDMYQNLIGYVPVFGTFFSNDGSDSLLTEPFLKAKSAFETTAKLSSGILTGETELSDWNKAINAVVDSLGATGLPSVQIKRGIKTFAPNGLLGEDFAFNPGYLFGQFGAGVYSNTFGRLL